MCIQFVFTHHPQSGFDVLVQLLLSICSLLTDPNPTNFALEVNDMFRKDRGEHDRIARQWTEKYARGEDEDGTVNINDAA